jgi:hypothetical protein
MRISLCVLLVASLTLGACGFVRDSALNPSNWFGRSTSETLETGTTVVTNPLIPKTRGLFARRAELDAAYVGQPFDEILDLTVERVAGGAIVRATGLAARQGIYAVALIPQEGEAVSRGGVLTYRLEGIEPDAATAVGGPATREVTAALKVTDQELRGVRSIRVEGLRNARVAQR